MTDLLQLLDAPQLGEFAWHQVTADPSIDHMSRTHLRSMEQLVRSAGAQKLDRPARVLELGSYRHYAGHLLADEHSAEVWLSDISAQALRDGKRLAVAKGIKRCGQLCTADFHDLPFADGWFDVVFIASAVHHTRTPERVLREMLRVLRPGGVLQLQNEPVGREFCAYAFNSNRAESFTNLEQAVDQAGLMRTVSSPFFGTRPEEMFQMVENDCIPLDLYLHELSQGAHIDELELRTDNTIGDLEKRMLGWVEKDPSTATARVAQHLIDLCRNLPTDDPAANAMGFRGLYANECWTLAGRLQRGGLSMTTTHDRGERERIRARLFGAALRARIVRESGTAAAGGALRRTLFEVDGVGLDVQGAGGAAYLGLTAELPDVTPREQAEAVLARHQAAGWGVIEESFGGNSLYNLGSTAELPIPEATVAILLMRVYTVPQSQPYRIVLRQQGRIIAAAVVAQAESRLLRGLVYRDGGPILIEHQCLDGRPLDIAGNLRVTVLQLLASSDPQ